MALYALGLIETEGYATAVSAADAALKAASVELLGVEKVIGVNGTLGVTIQLGGDVGAVRSAVEAGKMEAEKVGKVVATHVIARTHQEVNDKILPLFALSPKQEESEDAGLPDVAVVPDKPKGEDASNEKKRSGKPSPKKETSPATANLSDGKNAQEDKSMVEDKTTVESKAVTEKKGESNENTKK